MGGGRQTLGQTLGRASNGGWMLEAQGRLDLHSGRCLLSGGVELAKMCLLPEKEKRMWENIALRK